MDSYLQRIRNRLPRGANWIAVVALFGLAVLFLWRVVLLGQLLLPLDMLFVTEPWLSESTINLTKPIWNPVVTDAIWQFYPMASYANEAWMDHIPLWDPYVLGGMPALARGEMFSNLVVNLLALIMPVGTAMSWAAICHIFLGCALSFLLLREMGARHAGAFLGALAFGFNGYLIGWLSFPVVTGSMIWLPLVFLGVERALRRRDWRWILLGSLGFGLQILSGSILWPFYGAVTLGLFVLYRSIVRWVRGARFTAGILPLWYGGLSLLLGAALAAPQLFLTAELFFHTQRTTALGANSFLRFYNLIRLLVPNISGQPLHGATYQGSFNYTETHIYFGILPLVFVVASLFSRRRKLAWGLVGIGTLTLLAVYGLFPFTQIVSIIYPVFLNTFPGRIFYVVVFTWAMAAGLGADWLLRTYPRRFLRWSVATGVAVTLLVGLLYAYLQFRGEPIAAGRVMVLSRIFDLQGIREGLLWLLVSTLMLIILGASRSWPRLVTAVVFLVVIADLFVAGIDYNPAFDPDLAFPPTESLRFLEDSMQAEDEPARMVTVNSGSILLGMSPQFYRLPTVNGYSSWVLSRFSEYANLTGSRGQTSINHVYFVDCCDPLFDALNVKYVYASPNASLSSATGNLDLSTRLDAAQITATSDASVARFFWTIDDLQFPVLYEHPPAEVSFELPVEKPVAFEAALAMDPESWEGEGDGVTFEVYVQDRQEASDLLFRQYVDPKHRPEDRGWLPIEVDLASYVGETITLSLVTTPGDEGNTNTDWAGWGNARISGYLTPTLVLVHDGPNRVYENQSALPRTWIVRQVIEVPVEDIDEVKRHLGKSDFDPAVEAIVETPDLSEGHLRRGLGGDTSDDRIVIEDYLANSLRLSVDLEEPGLLVLSDVMYPGWVVRVDGVKQPIRTTNL
ncbi:MAG: YfhO family protein, partial [Anaerolineae bacterium]